MGQYYKFVNLDKKQVCQRNWQGIKLMEHSYVGNKYCDDILNLLSNEWSGDRVIHVGDYACADDKTNTAKLIKKIVDSNNLKCSVYSWADMFEEVKPKKIDNIRYVYNLDKKEYVDLYRQPIQWCHYNDTELYISKINSFALLTGCGNGQGGGDYFHTNKNTVGLWAGDRLVSSVDKIKEYENYKQRDELYNELNKYYGKKKNYNVLTTSKIEKESNRVFSEYIDYLSKHDIDISKLELDEYSLTDKEKNSFNEILNNKKEIYLNNKKENICQLS